MGFENHSLLSKCLGYFEIDSADSSGLFQMTVAPKSFKFSDVWCLQLLPVSLPLQELSSQLESQGKVDTASFQALVTTLAQQNLAAAEKPDLEQYESRVLAWESEKRQLIQREKEMRERANQEKQERLAAKAAARMG